MSAARIAPRAFAELATTLRERIARGQGSRMLGSTLAVRVWAHRPALAEAWLGLMEAFHEQGVLPARTRELVRLKIASITACQACQLSRKCDEVSEQDVACLNEGGGAFAPAEQAALDFAALFAGDYQAIDDAHYAELARHYPVDHIVELNMFCALMLGGGRMTYVQRAY